MINTLKIKGRMAELGLIQKDIAEKLEISAPTVSQKLNNIRPMSLSEAEKMARLLGIRNEDFTVYFFTPEVAQCNDNSLGIN